MTEKPVTCASGSSLSKALSLMAKHGYRNLVVTRGGGPFAVVSSKEILARIHDDDKAELEALREMTHHTSD